MRGQPVHRNQTQHRASVQTSAIRVRAPRRDLPALRRGRRDLQPRLSRLAHSLSARSRPDDEDIRARRHQHAGAGETPEVQDPAGVHQRGLRRPVGAPPAGGILGQRQSDRHPVLLRRGQEVRRDAVLRLSPPARGGDQSRAHLQYLRTAHASRRRSRRVELHCAGAEGRTDHALWPGRADPVLLLRGRSGRGPHQR